MPVIQEAIVETNARLHLGFLDMNFALGRRFGSLGLAIDRPRTRVGLSRAPAKGGKSCERAGALLQKLKAEFGVHDPLHLRIEEAIPSHSGLGSGTQLALAVGAAFQALNGRQVDASAIAAILDRGARSGIGVGAFQQGGFLVDGGRAVSNGPAPIIARLPFPEEWRILLVRDDASAGVHGEEESAAFAGMPPAPEEVAGHFCRLTLMKILPSLAEKDLIAFSDGIRALQDGMGALFATYQGGAAFRSPRVREVLAWLDSRGINGSGQSSWGPTGFAFLAREVSERIVEEARSRFDGESGLRFELTTGCNRGATIRVR